MTDRVSYDEEGRKGCLWGQKKFPEKESVQRGDKMIAQFDRNAVNQECLENKPVKGEKSGHRRVMRGLGSN